MKFVLETISKSARLGMFSKDDKKVQTPLLLIYTKAGSVPNLGKEVLNFLTDEIQAVEVSVSTIEHMEDALNVYKKGLASYAGLGNILTFVTLKDTLSQTPSGFHEKGSVPIFTKSGRTNITAERYMNVIETVQPNFYHSLCDGDTNFNSSKKRVLKSLDRTEEFLKICIERHKNSALLTNSMFIGAIEGGYDLKMRENAMKTLLNFEEIGGYIVDGLHNNGPDVLNLDLNKVKTVVEHCINFLPQEKPKFMLGALHPVTLLHMIKLGVDVFDTSYPCLESAKNHALTFKFELNSKSEKRPFTIKLHKKRYKDEFIPILQNCMCLACQKHSRAYLNHLIATNELLAPILLTIHNLHHYIEFFKKIREYIKDDKLDELIEYMEVQKREDITDEE